MTNVESAETLAQVIAEWQCQSDFEHESVLHLHYFATCEAQRQAPDLIVALRLEALLVFARLGRVPSRWWAMAG